MSRFAGILVTLLFAGCSKSAGHLEWTVSYASTDLASQSASVDAWIVRGGCGGTERVYDAEVGGGAPNDGRSLASGVYGFVVEAHDAACRRVARGCTEARLPRSAPIDVVLVESPGPASCSVAACVSGRCAIEDASMTQADAGSDAAASDDAGSDATSMIDSGVFDAGMDSGTDAGVDSGVDAGIDSGADAGSATCADGVLRSSGHCYRLYDVNVSYADARTLCASWGGDAVVFDDAAEEAWVVANVATTNDYWLGMTFVTSNSTWLTVSGTTQTYFHWDPSDSTGSSGSPCARNHVGTQMWRDIDCTGPYRAICEKP